MTTIIAGPCSFETFEDTEATIKFLTGLGITHIRGGSLKYRSNPNDYQGQGEVSQWIYELKKDYDFTYVMECFDITQTFTPDIIQLGSRNMHNTTFLKELNYHPTSYPVIMKRHYAAGLNEFLNHAAYLNRKDVILCLRGIMGLWPQEQRFMPDVTDIPRLRQLMEERQLFDEHIDPLKASDRKLKYKICYDVSHSACHRDYVWGLVKCAMVYKPDYLMIECHNHPSRAMSDAQQQIDFNTFEAWVKEGLFDD